MTLSDIEDIRVQKRRTSGDDAVRIRRRNGKSSGGDTDCSANGAPTNDLVPSNYSVYLKTWGCSHNSSDSEYMAGILAESGFNIAESKSLADVWVLNSCTVKGPAEQHFKNEIENGEKLGKKIVLAGCVPQGERRAEFMKPHSSIGVHQIQQIPYIVEETLRGHTVKLLGKKTDGERRAGHDLSLPKIRKNPLIEIIPISTGCLNQCTYCKTKHARGELVSYEMDQILSRVTSAFSSGAREIWLTSEDLGCYGIDKSTTIIELLKKLTELIPPDCMLRIGMTNPPYILNHLEEICEILDHPRVYSFLHIPVQSGSDAVLGDMRREYCVQDFQRVVDAVRQRIPLATIATDIICGFPTETSEDFQSTYDLCSKNQFKVLFVNQFYPRSGTPAARMKRIDTAEVKRRTKLLGELFNSYRPYEGRVGAVYRILVTEISFDGEHYVGHNKFYEQVLIPPVPHYMGRALDVRITAFTKHSMTGVVVEPRYTKFMIALFIAVILLKVLLL